MHLVGFVIKKFVTIDGHMNVKNPTSPHNGYGKGAQAGEQMTMQYT